MQRTYILFVALIIFLVGCKPIREIKSKNVPEIEKEREAKILTAFFGLDNKLGLKALRLSKKAYKKDGMPLVFSQEINSETLEADDFEVTTEDGRTYKPIDVTLLPANEAFELRTVLLIGEYGSKENQPVSVKVVDDLFTRSGKNLKGSEQKVIRLEEGPILSYAEYFTFTEDYPYVAEGRGCDCPKEETNMVVTMVWSGGVRATDGNELGDRELNNIKVHILQGQDTITTHPFQLADLGDNDNNIDLCLKEEGIPIKVEVDEKVAIDPNDDKNPKTSIPVVSRW